MYNEVPHFLHKYKYPIEVSLGQKTYNLRKNKNYNNFIFSTYMFKKQNSKAFLYLTLNFFKLFFSTSKVEVPSALLNLTVLNKPINLTYVYKFSKYLTLHGNFLRSTIQLSKSWSSSLSFYLKHINSIFSNNPNNILKLGTLIQNIINPINSNLNLRDFFSRFVRLVQPLYTVYTYKVSKNIYKNTRGKSGKFMFLLKYVPTYKRFFIISNWLVKELRVLNQRKLHQRLTQLIYQISNSPSNTWISRLNNFSHTYVYRNCKSTLGSTYRYVKA